MKDVEVNNGNLAYLDSITDVHVLTGVLTLYFTELKEPLIPWIFVRKLGLSSSTANTKSLIEQMPEPNKSTMETLMIHLIEVTRHWKVNQMDIPNMAMIFEPLVTRQPNKTEFVPTKVCESLLLYYSRSESAQILFKFGIF